MKYKLAITQRRGVSRIVGSLFQELAMRILDGEECDPEVGDFCHHGDFSFWCEVKASDDSHGICLPKAQFDQHGENDNIFLFRTGVYVLSKYNSRQGVSVNGKPRRSLLARIRSQSKIRSFLAERRISMHILDRSVVEALEKHFYPQGELPLGLDGGETIEIKHKTLAKFSHPTEYRIWLRELGLRGVTVNSFGLVVPYQQDLFSTLIKINVTTVLPWRFSRKLDNILFPGRVEEAAAA